MTDLLTTRGVHLMLGWLPAISVGLIMSALAKIQDMNHTADNSPASTRPPQ